MSNSPQALDENASPIVDCDLLEAAKENVQPLAMGRRVTALSAILATPHAHREAKLSATRNKLRINVELAMEDEEGDPLDAYCQLVYWTVENYPQGHSAESGLIELLEAATRELKDDRDGQWRGDIKYLKLWLLYASYVEKPTVIYKFLIANEIGTDHALLYEEHAAVLERDGRRKEADEAYALGIARKAQPLDHLQSRYEDFQKRMMSNLTLPPAESSVPSSRPPRQALATTSSGGTATPAQGMRSTSLRQTPSSSSSPTARATSTSQTNSRLQIFVDPSGESAQAAEVAGASTNEWNELGTRKTRIKENVPEVKKMVGSTIKQPGKSKRLAAAAAGTAPSSSTSKIAIFRDPPPNEGAQSKTPASSSSKGFVPFVDTSQEDEKTSNTLQTSPSPAFTPFRDDDSATSLGPTAPSSDPTMLKAKKVDTKATEPSSEADALRRDPLKNYPERSLGVDVSRS